MGRGSSTVWECQNCGAQFPKWTGQCPECQKWNSLVETVVSTGKGRGKREEGRGRAGTGVGKPQTLSEILKTQVNSSQRIGTGIGELDRVLGGGLVPGEVVLLAGEPGMGKSTLLSRVALAITREEGRGQKEEGNSNVLYVCGEESPGQVALRLQRLAMVKIARDGKDGYNPSHPNNLNHSSRLSLFSETNVDTVVAEIERQAQKTIIPENSENSDSRKVRLSENRKIRLSDSLAFRHSGIRSIPSVPNSLVIVDSIQTLTTDDLTGVAGSVGQVRESAGRLMAAAKSLNIPIFLVGHVTKDGTVAGPKVLEHMVDAVLVLEGERSGNFRILRAVKNRFGAVDEVGLFAMDNGDMKEVVNPGELLLGGAAGKVPGSVLGCTLEGLRPLILEVQALAVPSKLAVPRRVGQGINERKLQVLCAVIERYVNRKLGDMDIFVSIAGGLTSSDPALDLPVVAAIISSTIQKTQIPENSENSDSRKVRQSENQNIRLSDSPVLQQSGSRSIPSVPILCGEVGLLGEIRQVQGWERREKEVKRLEVGQLVGANKIKNIRELSLSFLA